ncbi:tagatose 1,6-diphosphate aldolase [Anaerococcus sp. AGMB00486]|uniref:Tagatose 1,6-diphosphate aldolase n=1 Tax=Anaerococcus faecalis TaxID=2742993 RepID=A0ABX2N8V0_9FIRM|nr:MULTISPECIES: tagatose 1,6-diphosphate aldolase [Anaerococcus]MDY3005897.1 tagatose 1,6-diphosphate aldolase [Anaerococcus porci]NVF11131.1 tagatose 1,6-diphosphate aldolase [Anaerococcus faecalis]
MKISKEKVENLKKLANENGVIAALAIDQRGSMEKMIGAFDENLNNVEDISRFKSLVSKQLTKYSSSILLDPIYGLEAIKVRDENAGLLISYEVTGFDKNDPERLPKLIDGCSVLRLKELGAEAIKILLYYDVDQSKETNDKKKAFIERIGYECEALGLPFFLELIVYDEKIEDSKSAEFAKVRPHKVNAAVKDFQDERYKIDVLKLETPVNMNFVEGYGKEVVYSQEEASKFFKEQSDISKIPFIFLSGGVSADLFKETLKFAKEAGSEFNGVLCGRATWKGGVEEFAKSDDDAIKWLNTQGLDNIQSLNKVLKETAKSVFDKIEE